MELIPVILSGGVGSRLWPVSRETHPKPFMTLPDGHTLIQKAFLRAAGLVQVAEVLTVTNRGLLFKTEDEYRSVNSSELPLGYILEPFGRNTACAVAAAALRLQQSHGPQAYMLILAADHLIQKDDAFRDAVAKAISLASEGWLVTFGVTPRYPETGFGYIETASEVVGAGLKVERFVEKPDLQNVKSYLATGNYFWNTGMFCFQVGTVLEEFKQHAPDVLEVVERTLSLSRSSRASGYACLVLDSEQFAQARDISIDYALMERSSKVATVPCDLEWSDIGSWNAVSELTGADEHDDRFEGEVMAYAASNNYVHTEDRLAALVDVQDPLVVDTQDALLIAHKDRAQEVKHIVTRLKREGHAAHLMHRTVHRPRGTYATLEECERFKIKRIVVKPKASLSLQLHHHRSEHWIFVSGLAVVINDDRELILNTNESTYIRAGNQHRLQNPGVIDLVIIEVQSGEYLGEDDIVRFEDNYGRCGS